MPRAMAVGLSPGHIVLDGDPASPPQKWAQQPLTVFHPCLLSPNGRMDQDATWCVRRTRPRRHCVRWRLSFSHGKGHSTPPLLGPCLLWPNSATAKLLSSFHPVFSRAGFVGRQEGHPAPKNIGGWWSQASLVSPDGVAPSQMVGVSASANLPLLHKVQTFSSGTGSPGWSWKKGHKSVMVVMFLDTHLFYCYGTFGHLIFH